MDNKWPFWTHLFDFSQSELIWWSFLHFLALVAVPVIALSIFLTTRTFTQLVLFLARSWTLRSIPRYKDGFLAWKIAWNEVDWVAVCQKMRRKDGKFAALLNLGPSFEGRHYIAVSDPELVKYVLLSPESDSTENSSLFSKLRNSSPTFSEALPAWVGESLLSSQGALWHLHRKACTPLFFYNVLKYQFSSTVQFTHEFIRTIRIKDNIKLSSSTQAHHHQTTSDGLENRSYMFHDLSPLFSNHVMKCILNLIAGPQAVRQASASNSKHSIDWIVQQHLKITQSFTQSLTKTHYLGGKVWQFLGGRFSNMMPMIGGKGSLHELQSQRYALASYFQSLINELREEEMEEPGPVQCNDLLSMLFYLKLDEDFTIHNQLKTSSTLNEAALDHVINSSRSNYSRTTSADYTPPPSPPLFLPPKHRACSKSNLGATKNASDSKFDAQANITSPEPNSTNQSTEGSATPRIPSGTPIYPQIKHTIDIGILRNSQDKIPSPPGKRVRKEKKPGLLSRSNSKIVSNKPLATSEQTKSPAKSPTVNTLESSQHQEIPENQESKVAKEANLKKSPVRKSLKITSAPMIVLEDREELVKSIELQTSPALLERSLCNTPMETPNSQDQFPYDTEDSDWMTSSDEEDSNDEEASTEEPSRSTFDTTGAPTYKQTSSTTDEEEEECVPGSMPERAGHLHDETLIDQAFSFLASGYQPITSTILWCVYHLATDSTLLSRIQAEVHDVFDGQISNGLPEQHTNRGFGPSSAQKPADLLQNGANSGLGIGDIQIDAEQLSKLRYTRNFVKEVLRFHPATPIIERIAEQDTKLGGAFLPEGTAIGLMVWNLHHDPTYWKEPERFMPERFESDQSKEFGPQHPFSYIPFSNGAHSCIGQKFAFQTILVTIALLARAFDLEISPDHLVKETYFDGTTLPSELRVRLKPRKLKKSTNLVPIFQMKRGLSTDFAFKSEMGSTTSAQDD